MTGTRHVLAVVAASAVVALLGSPLGLGPPGTPKALAASPSATTALGRAPAPAWTKLRFFDGVDAASPSELGMIRALAGRYPLTVRLYTGCWGHALPVRRTSATWAFRHVAAELEAFERDGIPMMVSLSYDPPITTEPPEPADEALPSPGWPRLYARCVADFVHAFAGLRELRAVDVTNEPNVPNEATSDGSMPLVEKAVVDGVEAARRALPAWSPTEVGFSFAYSNDPDPADLAFFSALGALGGPRFAAATQFVDLHLYPGTWEADYPSPRVPPTSPDAVLFSTRLTTTRAIVYLRRTLMPLAGLGPRVGIEIGETGYRSGGPGSNPSPTAFGALPGNDADQLQALVGEWDAAFRAAGRAGGLGVRSFIWFRLADPYLDPSACAPPWPVSGIFFNCTSGFGLLAQPSPGTFRARPSFCGYEEVIAHPSFAASHLLRTVAGATPCTPRFGPGSRPATS